MQQDTIWSGSIGSPESFATVSLTVCYEPEGTGLDISGMFYFLFLDDDEREVDSMVLPRAAAIALHAYLGQALSAGRQCLDCLRCDYDSGDSSVGMPGYIYCEADTESILDLEGQNYAHLCPLYQPKDADSCR